MFIVVGIIVVVLVILFLWIKLGMKSGYVAYQAEAQGAVKNGKSYTEAILAGLNLISYRKPFSELSETDKQSIATLYGRFNDVTVLKGFILEAEKKQNVAVLKDKDRLISYAKFLNDNK